MSFKRLIFILIFLCVTNIHITNCNDDQNKSTDLQQPKEATPSEKTGRALFSPRMEYNEWLPVGRGDPLKDPTYDYVPPVLDRVRYWADAALSQKDKSDILLLGVPSKKLTSKQKEKTQYGPIRRNYYSQQYQQPYIAPTQQRQELPTRLMPPPMYHSEYQMATQSWQTHNNIYDSRPEHSNNYISVVSPSTIKKKPFLPTVQPPHETESTTQTQPQSNSINIAMMSDGFKLSAPAKQFKKPLLHTILRTETAAPFTKTPSSTYPINYTENIYNPESINSMAAINNVFQPTEPTVRPFSMTTTLPPPAMTTDSMFSHYKQPMHGPMRGPMYLIIEGHSKVKTYGLKNDDILERHLPKIRQISNNQDPVVRRIVDETPVEYRVKHLHVPKKDPNKYFQRPDGKTPGAMSNLLTLLDTSFGNFLSNDSDASDEDTEEIPKAPKSQKNRKGKEIPEPLERKTRSLQEPEHQHKRLSVSFQVDDGQPAQRQQYQQYRKGTVITEKLFPLTNSSR